MGKLFLIPCPIAEDSLQSLPPYIKSKIEQLDSFVVERIRTTRRFIRRVAPELIIDDLTFHELDKKNPSSGLEQFLTRLKSGKDIGVLSEAGCPGVADPGHLAVQWAHRNGIEVVPLVGPSSILLALMASGMNGQNFAFNGYLPNKKPSLIQELKRLAIKVKKENQTQLFMDAPYRNHFLLDACIEALPSDLNLCIACDLDSATQDIMTQRISAWSKIQKDKYHKRPAMFVLGK